jgi:hypothetical protein
LARFPQPSSQRQRSAFGSLTLADSTPPTGTYLRVITEVRYLDLRSPFSPFAPNTGIIACLQYHRQNRQVLVLFQGLTTARHILQPSCLLFFCRELLPFFRRRSFPKSEATRSVVPASHPTRCSRRGSALRCSHVVDERDTDQLPGTPSIRPCSHWYRGWIICFLAIDSPRRNAPA